MTRRMNASLLGGLGVLTLASAMGCESQVNDDYTGEPMLSLQGNVVVSEEQADSDLVPQLAFLDYGEDANAVRFIKGEITGEFPAKFRFDVTQPPPDSTLSGPWAELGLKGKGSIGYIVMRSANDARPILAYIDSETTYDPSCVDDGAACTGFEVACAADGRCRERTIECSDHPCERVNQWGNLEVTDTATYSLSRCDSESCYSIATACNDANECRKDIYRCDFAQYGGYAEGVSLEGNVVTTCNIQSERKDPSLIELDDLNTVASEYLVVYVSEDSPDSAFGSLKKGYNLVWMNSMDGWLEAEKCAFEFSTAALAAYNEEHGTNFDEDSDEPAVEAIDEAAWEKCGGWRVIAQPLDETLTIELGSELPQF